MLRDGSGCRARHGCLLRVRGQTGSGAPEASGNTEDRRLFPVPHFRIQGPAFREATPLRRDRMSRTASVPCPKREFHSRRHSLPAGTGAARSPCIAAVHAGRSPRQNCVPGMATPEAARNRDPFPPKRRSAAQVSALPAGGCGDVPVRSMADFPEYSAADRTIPAVTERYSFSLP